MIGGDQSGWKVLVSSAGYQSLNAGSGSLRTVSPRIATDLPTQRGPSSGGAKTVQVRAYNGYYGAWRQLPITR